MNVKIETDKSAIDVRTIRFNSDSDGRTGLGGLVDDYIIQKQKENWHVVVSLRKYDEEQSKAQKQPVYTNIVSMIKYNQESGG